MRTRIIIFSVLLMLLSLAAQAQNIRVVRGSVITEDGAPLKGAVIVAENGDKYYPREDGSFEIRIPSVNRTLSFKADGYVTVTREISGLYLLVKMTFDQEAVKQAEQEAREKEEQARKAEQERLAAMEQARRDSLATAEKARKDSLAAIEQAKKEAEARAKAERLAKEKAEKERLAAIEQARRDSIAIVERARKEAEAQALAEKKADAKKLRQEKDTAYDGKYRNKGIEHSVDVSYSYPLKKCEVYYHYSGRMEYGVLHPFELDYTLSYRINRIVSVGAGAGLLYHAKSITIVNDAFSPAYNEFKEQRMDVPAFGAVKLTPLRSRIRPVIGGSAGYYLLSRTLMWEGDLGAECRISRRGAAHLLLSVRSTPYPYFNEAEGIARYQSAISPCVKIGFSFYNSSLTFSQA